MKKNILVLLVLVGCLVANLAQFPVYAETTASVTSNASVGFYRGSDSPATSRPNSNHLTQYQDQTIGKENKRLPKTNDKNSIIILIIGYFTLSFLIIYFVTRIYKKIQKRKEKI